MGGTSSKQQSKQDGWNTSLSRSVSIPTSNYRFEAKESPSKAPWKSKSFSMPKPAKRERTFSSVLSLSSKLKPVQEEESAADHEEEIELSGEDFENKKQDNAAGVFKTKNNRSLRRSVSFQPAWEPGTECRFSISHKSFKEGMIGGERPSALDLNFKLDSALDIGGFSSKDVKIDRSLGLRSLLSPALTPSRSFASPTRNASDFRKMLPPRRSFNLRYGDGDPGLNDFSARASGFHDSSVANNAVSRPEWMTTVDALAEPGSSPLFDPSILATFEKALEALSDDSWQSSDLSTTENISISSETSSDADSPKLQKANDVNTENFVSVRVRGDKALENSSDMRSNAFLNKRFSFSRLFSLKNDDRDWSGQDYLDRFEMRCPPGCEDKILLYFTSLRGIRKTFEDCCTLRLILKGFRVHVDERDVWMHSKFRQELTEVMGAALSVPRLFILGRHIGGAEEVEQLHEEGILAKMLEGLPTEWRQACDVCGDVRFIPCTTCSGSCKTVSQDDTIERCPDCNENGLIMCLSC